VRGVLRRRFTARVFGAGAGGGHGDGPGIIDV
jgi:hypothetical protein